MNEYNVSDYGIFTDALATTKKLNESLDSNKKTVEDVKNNLNNESVFMGPICDDIVENCGDICNRITLLTDNYNTIGSFLTDTATNYKAGDKSANSTILSVNSSGKVEAVKASAASFSGSNNQEKLYSYLSSQGFNDAAICGILANIQHESSFDTTAVGDGGTSYGICQWHAGRWDSLKSFCEENNLDDSSIEGQAKYLVNELKNSYPGVYETLKSVPNTADGAYQAAYKWTTDYEVPADIENMAALRGNTDVDTYWDQYGSSE